MSDPSDIQGWPQAIAYVATCVSIVVIFWLASRWWE